MRKPNIQTLITQLDVFIKINTNKLNRLRESVREQNMQIVELTDLLIKTELGQAQNENITELSELLEKTKQQRAQLLSTLNFVAKGLTRKMLNKLFNQYDAPKSGEKNFIFFPQAQFYGSVVEIKNNPDTALVRSNYQSLIEGLRRDEKVRVTFGI